ncbi:hypothetical protein QYF36_016432 [Acer negundo]|nr:hypothetical protein QYF36_016432 [Acer negundo]
MKAVHFLVASVFLALASSLASASDPSPLRISVVCEWKVLQGPKLATPNDFFFSGLNNPRNTENQVGSTVTPVNVAQIPGLNTLGISLAHIDFAPYGGLNPPHTHPRATEILVVQEGTLYVGFVTSNPENKLFTKNPGVITIANAVLGSNPAINPDVLSKAFQLDQNVVKSLQKKFWWDNN